MHRDFFVASRLSAFEDDFSLCLDFISRYLWGHFPSRLILYQDCDIVEDRLSLRLIRLPASASVDSDHRRYAADLRRSLSLGRSTLDGVDDRRPSSRRSRIRFIRRRFLGILHYGTTSMHLSFGPVAALYLVSSTGNIEVIFN